VLFFLELNSRRVHFAGCTANPDRGWTTQQARQLAWSLPERAIPARFLIHDRDSKFSRAFDALFRNDGISVIRTPVRAPNANAHIERWVGSVRRECLDRMLIFSRRQLERVLRVWTLQVVAVWCSTPGTARALRLTVRVWFPSELACCTPPGASRGRLTAPPPAGSG
jgi:transposase InsO family protein